MEKKTIQTGVQGRPEVCFPLCHGLHITYATMSRLAGESKEQLVYRIFKKGLSPLQAIRREGMSYQCRRRTRPGNAEWQSLGEL